MSNPLDFVKDIFFWYNSIYLMKERTGWLFFDEVAESRLFMVKVMSLGKELFFTQQRTCVHSWDEIKGCIFVEEHKSTVFRKNDIRWVCFVRMLRFVVLYCLFVLSCWFTKVLFACHEERNETYIISNILMRVSAS